MARTREQRLDDMTWIEYQALASRAHSFSGVLTENRQGPRVRLPDRDDFPITAGGSDNYFDLLGVKALMGDVFHTGKGEDGTVVLAYKYWKDMLAGDLRSWGAHFRWGAACCASSACCRPDLPAPTGDCW